MFNSNSACMKASWNSLWFSISALWLSDSKEILDGIKAKDVLDKISAIFRTVTSNLDIK